MTQRAPSSQDNLDVDLVAWDSSAGTGPLLTGHGWLLGLLIWNDTAAPVRVDLWDGQDATGARMGRVYVPATAHAALNLPRPGWPFATGVTLLGNGSFAATALIAKVAR